MIEDPAFGLHVLRVAAVDAEGNVDRTPASAAWSWQVGSEIWLHVDDCWLPGFPGCGMWDGLNGSGWTPGTWIHPSTDPDLAYKYPDGTTGAFQIRTHKLNIGVNVIEINVGGLPDVGTNNNGTDWLFGFDWLEDPAINPSFGHPFQSHRSWFEIEYSDGADEVIAQNCDWTAFVLLNTSEPDNWGSHVGRGRARVVKGYDGRLTISAAGNRDYYEPWFARNAASWMSAECKSWDDFSTMVTSP